MPRAHLRLRRLAHVVVLGLLAWLAPGSAAHAQQVEVLVTLLQKSWSSCVDDLGPPDIYSLVKIDNVELQGPTVESNFSFWDTEEQYSQNVDFSKGTITIEIRQRDNDEPFSNPDVCAVTEAGGSLLTMTLDMNTCTISGGVNGSCGDRFEIERVGNDYDLFLDFTIDIQQPAAAPGLNINCSHSPLWPQPGQDVTITLQSLDGNLAPKLGDALEIWVNDRTVPVQTTMGMTATYVIPAIGGTDFTYGCQVTAGVERAWTGWRTVAIGQSTITNQFNGRVPIIFVGPRKSALDFVFYHDTDNFTGATDPNFQAAMTTAIQNAFLADGLILANQHRVNFWLALNGGDAKDDCESSVSGQRGWEDASIILHTDGSIRNCGLPDERLLTTIGANTAVLQHELGHVPFGLADEYCCDGGYFEDLVFPNLYESRDNPPFDFLHGCVEDAATLGRSESACRSFEEDIPWWFDDEWWTSDPGDTTPGQFNDDLMSDNGPRQLLDIRRMNYVFLVCGSAGC